MLVMNKDEEEGHALHSYFYCIDCLLFLFKFISHDAHAADLHYISPIVSVHLICPVPFESPQNV